MTPYQRYLENKEISEIVQKRLDKIDEDIKNGNYTTFTLEDIKKLIEELEK